MTGYGPTPGQVVLHADDFGMNVAVNQGILLAFREGLLTSTSLLANAPASKAACLEWPKLIAEFAVGNPSSRETRKRLNDSALPFDLGIHVNLTQGRPLTGDHYPPQLLDSDGNFPGIGSLFSRIKRVKYSALQSVEKELQTQVEMMCDCGFVPTHLNGHQYIELIPQVAAFVPTILRRYSISVIRVAFEPNLTRNVLLKGRPMAWGLGLVKRHYASAFRHQMQREKFAFPNRFFGTSHAGKIDFDTVDRFLGLKFLEGCTEIGVHPAMAYSNDANTFRDPWFDPLAELRVKEFQFLCSSKLSDLLAVRNISLGRLQSLGSNRD